MKTPFIVLVAIFIGFASYYVFDRYQTLKVENENLKASVTTSPRPTASTRPVTDVTATMQPSASPAVAQTGSVTGTLGYPSSGIPPLEVFAFNSQDLDEYYSVKTNTNQATFTINNIKPGQYVFVAYPQDSDQLAGGYSKMVPCGLLASCTDHSLIPVTISAGVTNQNIVEIKDWYAPEGTFPAKP